MADTLLGSFVWCELMTTDMKAAESFYRTVVGWQPVPFTPDGSYTVFNNAAGGVGGVMNLPDSARHMGAPPHWLMYLGTPNVDDTAMRVVQLGGRVHKQPEDIPHVGRFAVVQDPFGATFALLQPKPAPGTPERKRGGVGDFSWFELYTPNPEGAWKFYQTLFGWEKTSAMDMGDMGTYQMFGRGGGIPNGGIIKPPPGAPAAWQPYAMVKNAKAAAAAAASSGGKIVNGPMEVPGGDWIAVGTDPQGAMFAVHSLNPATARQAQPANAERTQPKARNSKGAKPAMKRGKPKQAPNRKAVNKKTAKKAAAKKPAPKKGAAKKAAKKKAAKKKASKTARRKR